MCAVHPLLDFREQPFESLTSMRSEPASVGYAVTVVPTASPITTRRMLPGVFRLKTTIGSLLSMHSEIAVASITCSRCCSTWRYEMLLVARRRRVLHRIGGVDAVDLGAP